MTSSPVRGEAPLPTPRAAGTRSPTGGAASAREDFTGPSVGRRPSSGAGPSGSAGPSGTDPSAAVRAAHTVILVVGPLTLLGGIVYHPHVPNLTDKASVAHALQEDTGRWLVSHLVVGVAAVLLVLAFLALRAVLREAGERRWSAVGIPFAVVGSVLFAFLPAMEVVVLAAAQSGAEAEAVLVAMDPVFRPVLLSGALFFGIAAVCFAVALLRTRVAGRTTTGVVVAALLVAAGSRFLPLGTPLVVGAVAVCVALLPLALVAARPAAGVRPQ
jgi:hypothetical protein